ncbi:MULTISPECIES: twin-arginine translocation signal domain-containing protein [Halorussus]|uniref:twin-arginine translocation signal domain-containing protein n=1 Tax=Halorussus TaxID=1070314 RepID=UPI00209DE3CE|nr:twin-arginine translocation signal domain-containing protein [Halorussus vallis]USZ76300.1 twin-arginine translocation signal domain-containing protein [Halorussus vallis]
MNRRRFLQAVGVGAVTALAGCPNNGMDDPPASDRADPPIARADFDRVVNVVQAGADATGKKPIDSVLNRELRDGTLFVFPDGRYAIDGFDVSGSPRVGMVAAEGATPMLVPTTSAPNTEHTLLEATSVKAFLFDGFVLDFRRKGYGGRVFAMTDGPLTVRNVRTLGKYPRKSIGFHFAVRDRGSDGLIQNVVAPQGGRPGGESVGMFVDRRHAGDLLVRNCHLERFPNNGLYASAPGGDGGLPIGRGRVRVHGGYYRNNNISNVRLGGEGSEARGVTVAVDEVPPHNELNARGVLLQNGRNLLVEDCKIVIGKKAGYSLGAVVFHEDAATATIRNTQIVMDRDDLPAINARKPARNLSGATGANFQNVSITGTASGGRTVVVENRDGTRVRDCKFVQSGDDRSGIVFSRSDDCVVARSTIDVTGDAIATPNSTIRRRKLIIR